MMAPFTFIFILFSPLPVLRHIFTLVLIPGQTAPAGRFRARVFRSRASFLHLALFHWLSRPEHQVSGCGRGSSGS